MYVTDLALDLDFFLYIYRKKRQCNRFGLHFGHASLHLDGFELLFHLSVLMTNPMLCKPFPLQTPGYAM